MKYLTSCCRNRSNWVALAGAFSWMAVWWVVEARGLAPTVVSTGLRNLGNTCYLNAQLQCAFHIPKVRSILLTEPPLSKRRQPQPQQQQDDSDNENEDSEEDDDSEEEASSEDGSVQDSLPKLLPQSPGLVAMRSMFKDMLEASTSVTQQPVAPQVLCRALGIPVMEQQDSQEFWKLLLPALQVPALTSLYRGSFEDYIVALDGSNRERRREEAFLDISLDVSESRSVLASVQKSFGEPELLSVQEGNGWRPDKGADKVDAHKGSQLFAHSLPSILQLHLKRFNFDWNRNVMEKLNSPFSFPLELDMSSVCRQPNNSPRKDPEDDTDDAIYDLQSVLIHAGEFGIGHYYAYVRPNVQENTWYRFNDDIVTPVSYEEVVADATGGRVQANDISPPMEKPKKRGWLGPLRRLFQGGGGASFGYGGPTSNAYVLQYVRRSAVPDLYHVPGTETALNARQANPYFL